MVIPLQNAKTRRGGMEVDVENLWQAFLETGAPEIYVLYALAKKVEEPHVFNGSGIGSPGNEL